MKNGLETNRDKREKTWQTRLHMTKCDKQTKYNKVWEKMWQTVTNCDKKLPV